MQWIDPQLASGLCQEKLLSRWEDFLLRRHFGDTLKKAVEKVRFATGLTQKDREVFLEFERDKLPSDWLHAGKAELVNALATTGLSLGARAILVAYLRAQMVTFAAENAEFFHDFAKTAMENRWGGYGEFCAKVEELDSHFAEKLVELENEISQLGRAHLAVEHR